MPTNPHERYSREWWPCQLGAADYALEVLLRAAINGRPAPIYAREQIVEIYRETTGHDKTDRLDDDQLDAWARGDDSRPDSRSCRPPGAVMP